MQADRSDSAVPVELFVDSNGGVAGLTAVVAVRDPSTSDSYLDFDDLTFKVAGWTTRQAAMSDVGNGAYRLAAGLDIAGITNLPAGTKQLALEYSVSGALTLDALETLVLVEALHDPLARSLAGFAAPSAGRVLDRIRVYLTNRTEIDIPNQRLIVYEDDGLTPAQRWDVETNNGPPDLVIAPPGTTAKRSDPLDPL